MIAVYARKTHYGLRPNPRRLRFYQDILAEALGTRTYTPNTYIPNGITLVNWGCSSMPQIGGGNVRWIGNTPEAIAVLSNKLKMFNALHRANVPCLTWTQQRRKAEGWLKDGFTVYARTVLQGHSGKGIVRVKPGGVLPDASIYTRAHEGKFREYRVHVFDGKIVNIQIKRRMSAAKMQEMGIVPPDEETRSAVRVWKNGWAFCISNIKLSDKAKQVAIDAITACGGTMGATDLLTYGDNQVKVIETNSAPALLSPTTTAGYVKAIREAA